MWGIFWVIQFLGEAKLAGIKKDAIADFLLITQNYLSGEFLRLSILPFRVLLYSIPDVVGVRESFIDFFEKLQCFEFTEHNSLL